MWSYPEIYEGLNQPDVASLWWRRAIALDRQDACLQVRLALDLQKSGDPAGALGALQQARSIDPGREEIGPLLEKMLAAQTGAPSLPAGRIPPAGPPMPLRSPTPDLKMSVPVPQPPDPLRGYPTPGGNPR